MSEQPFLVKESWLQKVGGAVSKLDGTVKKADGAKTLFYDIRPARLQTAWAQNQAGLWTATARFIVNDVVDDSFTFNVCAPTATSSPGGTAQVTRFFVVWRGRWEAIQQNIAAPRYTGGDHIQVSGAAGPDGYAIDNKGVCEAKLVTGGVADSYADTGTLYLGGAYFKWVPSTLDIIGKKELWLKTSSVGCLSGVSASNGAIVFSTVNVTGLSSS